MRATRSFGAQVEPLLRGYVSGVGLEKGAPALALRNYVAERLSKRTDSSRSSSLRALRCVQAFIQGEKLDRLQASDDAYLWLRGLEENRKQAA